MTPPRAPKYNPAFLAEEDLLAGFAVRGEDLDWIIESIRENRVSSNQHLLVVGPRGMGKTTLVRRAAASVRREPALARAWFPILFGEETYEVATPAELWLEAIYYVGKQTGDAAHQKAYETLRLERDEKRLYDRALGYLMDFSARERKRLLVVVENLNMVLSEQLKPDDAWVLRKTLQTEPRIMVLATSPTRFEDIEQADRAMYELFRIHDLRPLDLDECRTLWKAVTGNDLPGLSIRPIQILTGGNPRLIAILGSFAGGHSLRDLMDDLNHLVDEHTAYFKTNLEILPPPERKVFAALADLWRPALAREVAEVARVDVNLTSTYLNRLVQRGAVEPVGQAGRARKYQIAERLYNIYHLMRRSGAPADQVRHIVDFMVGFYDRGRLIGAIDRIIEEACGLDPTGRREHFLVYEGLLEKIDQQMRRRIVAKTGKRLLALPDVPAGLRKKAEKTLTEAARRKKELQLRRRLKRNPASSEDWYELGTLLAEEPERQAEQEAALRQAIATAPGPFDEIAVVAVALLARKRLADGRSTEVEAELRMRLEEAGSNALGRLVFGYYLALALAHQARYSEALQLIEGCWMYAENHPEFIPKLREGRAHCHFRLGNPIALADYRILQQERPDWAIVWSRSAVLLFKERNFSAAFSASERALALNPKDGQAFRTMARASALLRKADHVRLRELVNVVEKSGNAAGILQTAAIHSAIIGSAESLAKSDQWSTDAERLAPSGETLLTRVLVLLRLERTAEAMTNLECGLSAGRSITPESVAELVLWCAAAGDVGSALKVLRSNAASPTLVPVRVALERLSGLDVDVPRELSEVALDVVKEIEALKSQYAAGERTLLAGTDLAKLLGNKG